MSDTAAALDGRFAPVRQLADAVLYEGCVLYPYRASAGKNQMRWQFGVVAPRPFSEADGSEPWSTVTECVAELSGPAVLDVRVRGLQLQARTVEEPAGGSPPSWRPTPRLEVDGRLWASWDEAVERQIDLPGLALDRSEGAEWALDTDLPGGCEIEPLLAASGTEAGRLRRHRAAVRLRLTVTATPVEGPYRLTRLRVAVANLTEWEGRGEGRDEVVRHSLVAAHVLLALDGGSFVSHIDPPEFARSAVAQCRNVGTFPVLAGRPGQRDLVLSSPIILYDHAEVAPESPGVLCDATEIDEILALRVMTLTDEEKREARATDARAGAIVDLCDTIPEEIFERLHGAVRALIPVRDRPAPESAEMRKGGSALPEPGRSERAAPSGALPWWDPGADDAVDPWREEIMVAGTVVTKGSPVRLRPGRPGGGRRADAQDLFLTGRAATVQAVFVDVDGERHVAVTVDDDPAADLYQSGGRFLYFHPDEIEPLEGRP